MQGSGSPPCQPSQPRRLRPRLCKSRRAAACALRRHLRVPLPLCHGRCGAAPGDHTLACPRTGLLARRANVVERVWVRLAREAVGAEGQVMPQQWLVHTTAPGVRADDRRRLDVAIYGATSNGSALCGDATLVSLHGRRGRRRPADSGTTQGGHLPELRRQGPQKLLVLGSEVARPRSP